MGVTEVAQKALSRITPNPTIGNVHNGEAQNSTFEVSDANQSQPQLTIRPDYKFSCYSNPNKYLQASFSALGRGIIKENEQSGDYGDFRIALRAQENPEQVTANLTESTQNHANKLVAWRTQSDKNLYLINTYGYLLPPKDGWDLRNSQFGVVATNPNLNFSQIMTEEMFQQLKAQQEQQSVA